jgi:hypothetical protein
MGELPNERKEQRGSIIMPSLLSPATKRRLLARLCRFIELEETAPAYYGPRILKISNILEI